MKKLFIFAMCATISLASCKQNKEQNHNEDIHTENNDHDHGDDVIVFSQEKAKASGVKSETAKKANFKNVIRVGGKIITNPGKESVIVANTPGIIQVPENLVEGLPINANQNLMAISSKNLQEGDPALKAKITFEIAKSEYDRIEPLVKEGIVTQKDFMSTKQAYENAKIAYEAISKGYSSKGLAIKSTQKGYIKEILVQNGQYVAVGDPILSIVENNDLYLRAEVPSKYYHELADITTANFKILANNETYSLDDMEGKLISYAKSLTSNDYMLPITFSFKNSNKALISGIYAEVYLLSREIPNIISLPHTAITEQEGLYFAYKQICKEEYEKVEIKLGVDNGQAFEIISGINEGDLIVTQGAQQIKLASTASAIPAHTHEH